MASKKTTTDASHIHTSFKVQAVYALELLIEIASRPESLEQNHLIGLEVIEDVGHLGGDINLIQIKNYDPEDTFTLNRDEVKKTLCNFLKIWCSYNGENRYNFIFSFTCKIGKERGLDAKCKSLGVPVPKIALLSQMKSKSLDNNNSSLIKDILKEYLEEKKDGFSENIKNLNLTRFQMFLHCIHIRESAPGYEDLKKSISEKLKVIINTQTHCPVPMVLNDLVQKFEDRQLRPSYFDRCFSNQEISNYFFRLSASDLGVIDPDWQAWDGLEAEGADDNRNLKEKILAVYPGAKQSYLSKINLDLASGKAMQLSFKSDQRFRALKFKVYKKSFSKLVDLKEAMKIDDKTKIDSCIKEIINEIEMSILEWMKDFKYPVTNRDAIEAMILDLFDSCFLNFEAEE